MTRPDLTYLSTGRPSGRRANGKRPASLPELATVVLKNSLAVENVGTLPAGSRGAIVFVYDHGAAYEVEFSKPFRTVVTIEANNLKRAAPA